MLTALSQATQALRDTVNTLVISNADLVSQVRSLSAVNTQLVTKLNSSEQISLSDSPKSGTAPCKPDMVIGDSMLRNIKPNSESLIVKSFGGAKTGDLLKTMSKMDANTQGDITIVIGTNDCSTRYPVDKIEKNVSSLINHAKRISVTGLITISEICPRADNDRANEKINELNPVVKALCAKSGCLYAENKNTFLHYDGSINMSLLSAVDRLHLSENGVGYLLKNLKLDTCAHPDFGQRSGNVRSGTWGNGRSIQNSSNPAQTRGNPVLRMQSTSDAPPNRDTSSSRGGNTRPSIDRPRHTNTGMDSRPNDRQQGGSVETHPQQRSYSGWRRTDAHPMPTTSDGHRTDMYPSGSAAWGDTSYHMNDHIEKQHVNNDLYCRNCGETNHSTRGCKYDKPLICHDCGRNGHKCSFCYLYK